ncbi:Methionine aminopeptidase [uncultured Bacteroides sp.]|jgi:methionyl aminopeptidase|nr:Methionine aminopeptidase [uncultured Bacteroides sp.]
MSGFLMFFKCIGEKYYTMVSGLIRFLLTLHIISILNYMVRNKINWRVPKGAELTELDKKVLYFQNKGHLVPSRKLIKTPEQIEGIRRSGVINTAVLDLVASEIKAGMSTAEIDKMVYDFTVSHGAIPAPLNYEGFPKSVCTSINEVVCHGIPSEDEILEEGDIINVDVSTILDGYYSDASRMFIIGKTSPEKEKLVRVAKECLEIGMQAATPFGFVGDIGNAIEKHAKKNGFSVVRDLCGHGVGLEFHEEPDVEHFGKKGTGMLLVPGMVFTIEPMINMGTYEVFVDEEDDWTVVTEDELPSAQWEHTFLMTENGLEILTY